MSLKKNVLFGATLSLLAGYFFLLREQNENHFVDDAPEMVRETFPKQRLPTRIGSPPAAAPDVTDYSSQLQRIRKEGPEVDTFEGFQRLGVEALLYRLAEDPLRLESGEAKNDLFRLGAADLVKKLIVKNLPLGNKLIGDSGTFPLSIRVKCSGIETFVASLEPMETYPTTDEVTLLIDYARSSSQQCSAGSFEDDQRFLLGEYPSLIPWTKGDYAETVSE